VGKGRRLSLSGSTPNFDGLAGRVKMWLQDFF
jgi:hypothetical protein